MQTRLRVPGVLVELAAVHMVQSPLAALSGGVGLAEARDIAKEAYIIGYSIVDNYRIRVLTPEDNAIQRRRTRTRRTRGSAWSFGWWGRDLLG